MKKYSIMRILNNEIEENTPDLSRIEALICSLWKIGNSAFSEAKDACAKSERISGCFNESAAELERIDVGVKEYFARQRRKLDALRNEIHDYDAKASDCRNRLEHLKTQAEQSNASAEEPGYKIELREAARELAKCNAHAASSAAEYKQLYRMLEDDGKMIEQMRIRIAARSEQLYGVLRGVENGRR